MRRLQQYSNYVDWIEPLHDIASEQTGHSDFGADTSYMTGLRVILEGLDAHCDLNDLAKYAAPIKLVHMLKQRLLAQQAFKQQPQMLDQPIEKPLLITGLVRTGSTALHYLISAGPQSPAFAVLAGGESDAAAAAGYLGRSPQLPGIQGRPGYDVRGLAQAQSDSLYGRRLARGVRPPDGANLYR